MVGVVALRLVGQCAQRLTGVHEETDAAVTVFIVCAQGRVEVMTIHVLASEVADLAYTIGIDTAKKNRSVTIENIWNLCYV